jgi:hypothetical protein
MLVMHITKLVLNENNMHGLELCYVFELWNALWSMHK